MENLERVKKMRDILYIVNFNQKNSPDGVRIHKVDIVPVKVEIEREDGGLIVPIRTRERAGNCQIEGMKGEVIVFSSLEKAICYLNAINQRWVFCSHCMCDEECRCD